MLQKKKYVPGTICTLRLLQAGQHSMMEPINVKCYRHMMKSRPGSFLRHSILVSFSLGLVAETPFSSDCYSFTSRTFYRSLWYSTFSQSYFKFAVRRVSDIQSLLLYSCIAVLNFICQIPSHLIILSLISDSGSHLMYIVRSHCRLFYAPLAVYSFVYVFMVTLEMYDQASLFGYSYNSRK